MAIVCSNPEVELGNSQAHITPFAAAVQWHPQYMGSTPHKEPQNPAGSQDVIALL